MGLSLRDASRLSGVSHTHIRDIEDGRSIPSFEMVMRFLAGVTQSLTFYEVMNVVIIMYYHSVKGFLSKWMSTLIWPGCLLGRVLQCRGHPVAAHATDPGSSQRAHQLR